MTASDPRAHQDARGRDAGDLCVREVANDDLLAISEMHIKAFPESVLGGLGPQVMERYYDWQLNGPHDVIALVACIGDSPIGFLFGGVFRGSTIGFVKREKWLLMRAVLTHPRVLARSVGWRRLALGGRLLARPSNAKAPVPEDPERVPRRSCGVLAIAVDPGAQGRGVGQLLMEEACERATRAGFERLHLSVHPTNHAAIRFYELLGFQHLDEPDGSWAGRMTLSIAPSEDLPIT